MSITKVKYDGKTHLNIYSKAQTELGRFLSNFTYCPIETEDGHFDSIEGYWYWLSCKDDRLRFLSGYAAKHLGRQLGGKDWLEDKEFKRKICDALELKLKTPEAAAIINANYELLNLPFDHYYVYGNKIHRPKEGQWIIEKIRSFIEENWSIL